MKAEKETIRARLSRLKEAIGGQKPSEFLPLDFGLNFGRIETKEELLNLITSLDDYDFSKFVFLFKFWVMGEKDWSLWRFDYEREVFKGETDPLRRLELLLNFFGGVRSFELDLEELEMTLRLKGRKDVERFLIAHKDLILSKGWHVDKGEEGIYVFRREK